MATNTNKKKKKKKKTSKRNIKQINKKALVFICAVFLIVAVVLTAVLVERNVKSNLIHLNKDVAYGIDVSHHNGKISWKTVKDEVDFAFIRVGYRGYKDANIYLDSRAKRNLKYANKNEVPIGVYFYSQAINEEEAEEEAKFLISNIKSYDISLPVVIDFEYPSVNGKDTGRLYDANLSRKEKTALINAFCKKVEKAGYTPGVYASSYMFKYFINTKKLDKDTMIWIADYNKEPSYSSNYDFWQYSRKGNCKGVPSKYVDTNYWYIEKQNNN
ncbi:MAG: hypothetical protein IJR70_00430 [Eubacterium sp.]|nr:hypothetical protein [Eubacterium sp.]